MMISGKSWMQISGEHFKYAGGFKIFFIKEC